MRLVMLISYLNTLLPYFSLAGSLNRKPEPNDSMDECRTTITGALEGLLKKVGLVPEDIDILVTTCSIYCPTPSMASMLVNHFKMRTDIQSYHLGGMGCANGVVAINLIRDLLQAHPHSRAVFVTTEVTTPAYYKGKDRHRLVPNVIFRMGAAAMLLSNVGCYRGHAAKYILQHHERVHTGQSVEAFRAIHYGPDGEGFNGIYLGKNVVTEASRGLTKAMKIIGPKVLSLKEKAKFMASVLSRRIYGPAATAPLYSPSFSNSIQHFLIHAGGSKVLDGLGKALVLSDWDLEPSRAVLHDYGNVSSSTTWYTLSYIESLRGVQLGDKVMQIGLGSGIKVGVNVWKAVRDINDVHVAWQHRIPPEQCLKRIDGTLQRQEQFVDVSCLSRIYRVRSLITFGLVIILMLLTFTWTSPGMLLK
ncbi:hypothetical protein CEUSTIGMA_g11266.t1 [Chlamydomonas eustigma]|uniref:3-ketoacyl-CoA synthase n=1 Tax=Chlamydomonas eustigma TaxID=1157962 RepID=A0A250XLS2_9CHLO|nr:hypothetical protein CEUSTIGMA_g11266.t1 [Chlamydomonas eustigma]|eukprot:GAX83842.1 hypothetical protein CEUSTIGMA_g11266.t1 [Chlamydomonas eustigma]